MLTVNTPIPSIHRGKDPLHRQGSFQLGCMVQGQRNIERAGHECPIDRVCFAVS